MLKATGQKGMVEMQVQGAPGLEDDERWPVVYP